jgi:hypothetical protein
MAREINWSRGPLVLRRSRWQAGISAPRSVSMMSAADAALIAADFPATGL